jgi:hypothetical protein
VLVVVEEPQGRGVQFGGTVAAPAARDILREALALLEVPPDDVTSAPQRLAADPARAD